LNLVAKGRGRHAGGNDVAKQRERNAAIRPYGNVAAEVRFTPEQNAQNVLGSNDKVGGYGHCRRSRGSRVGCRRA
jgi:hypothetical protein